MKISYCTTCHERLWQLKETIKHNLTYTKVGEVEICVLAYNDLTVEPYLKENYSEYILDGRLKVENYTSDLPYTCGRVKNFSHAMGTGEVLFNLDADNFIDEVHGKLLNLKPYQIFKGRVTTCPGESGRIGLHRTAFERLGGYRDVGRNDDGDLVSRALSANMRLVTASCSIRPLPNEIEHYQNKTQTNTKIL